MFLGFDADSLGRNGSSGIRRVGIVALARKLLVAFWLYLDQGIIPAGADLKPEGSRLR